MPAVGEHTYAYTSKTFKLLPRNLVAFRSKAKTRCPPFIFQQRQLGIAEEEDGEKKRLVSKGRNGQNT